MRAVNTVTIFLSGTEAKRQFGTLSHPDIARIDLEYGSDRASRGGFRQAPRKIPVTPFKDHRSSGSASASSARRSHPKFDGRNKRATDPTQTTREPRRRGAGSVAPARADAGSGRRPAFGRDG